MQSLKLIQLPGGFWAAHDDHKKIGAIGEARSQAISRLLMTGMVGDVENRIFNLGAPGYMEHPTLLQKSPYSIPTDR